MQIFKGGKIDIRRKWKLKTAPTIRMNHLGIQVFSEFVGNYFSDIGMVEVKLQSYRYGFA